MSKFINKDFEKLSDESDYSGGSDDKKIDNGKSNHGISGLTFCLTYQLSLMRQFFLHMFS